VANALEAMAVRVSDGPELTTPDLQHALDALERSSAALPAAHTGGATTDEPWYSEPLPLPRCHHHPALLRSIRCFGGEVTYVF
jgi:hypothetical protein